MNRYNAAYTDPPWNYRVWGGRGRGRPVESHCSTMSIEDIKELPIGKLVDRDCILFMWITFPLFKEMSEVLKVQGFKYETVVFTWTKQNKESDSLPWGMGYWTRTSAEICVLATKESLKRYSKGIHQVIVSHIERHSKKPEEARKRVEQLVGDVPKIELSVREKTDGWDTWGNEALDGISILESEVVQMAAYIPVPRDLI